MKNGISECIWGFATTHVRLLPVFNMKVLFMGIYDIVLADKDTFGCVINLI